MSAHRSSAMPCWWRATRSRRSRRKPRRSAEMGRQRRASKSELRERVWSLLIERRAARFPGARGRIPNFVGAEAAARRLAELPAWRVARVVKANPDAPQLAVRALALRQGEGALKGGPPARGGTGLLERHPPGAFRPRGPGRGRHG